jgi:hypothetical protein
MSTTTTDPEYIPRGPVETTLTFYVPPADGSTPYNYVESPPPNHPQRNYQEGPQRVQLTDLRGAEASYDLDTHALRILHSIPTHTTYATFSDDAEVRRLYYPEVSALLLDNLPGAHKVVLFDHTIRREDPAAPRHPVTRAHVDQTPRAAAERVRMHVEDPVEAEELLKGRYRIVNVWMPLNGAVQSSPLAFAGADSVDHDADLVPIEHRYPNRTGETMGVRFNPRQNWLYLSGVRPDERVLLKCADSAEGVGKGAPHTAFVDERSPVGARPRESIEVRALVFG